MRNLKIRTRLQLAFAIILGLSVIGSVALLYQFNLLIAQTTRLQTVDEQLLALTNLSNQALAAQVQLQQAAVAQNSQAFLAKARDLRVAYVSAADTAIAAIQADVTPGIADTTPQRLTEIRDDVTAALANLLALAEQDDWEAINTALATDLTLVLNDAAQLTNSVSQSVSFVRTITLERMIITRNQAAGTVAIVSILIILVGLRLSAEVRRSISESLTALDEGAQALSRGEFGYQARVLGDDELATFARAFNTATIQLAELYSKMENKVQQRTRELEYRMVQLRTNVDVSQQITAILDQETLMSRLVEIIRERYNLYFVGIYIYDHTREVALLAAGSGDIGRRLREKRTEVTLDDHSIPGWVMKQRCTALVANVREDPRHRDLPELPRTRATLTLPLSVSQRLLGALDMHSETEAAFDWDDVPILEALAAQVSIAIRNAELYAGEQSRRSLAEKLNAIGRALNSTLDMQKVQSLILDQLSTIVEFDRGAVMLHTDETLQIVAARGFPAEVELLQLHIPVQDDDLFDQILRTRQPMVLRDVQNRPDWNPIPGLPPARSWMGIPLQHGGRAIGILALTRETVAEYFPEEVTLATAFAAQAAVALENALLYARIVAFNHELEAEVTRRTEDLQKAFTQLERLDKSKSDFINVAAHELRTPLTLLKGYSQMLLIDQQIQANAPLTNLASGIHSGANRLQEIIDSMIDVARINNESLTITPSVINLGQTLTILAGRMRETARERQVRLAIDPSINELPHIEGDPELLYKVFSNLLENAIKYTPDGGQVTVFGRPRSAYNSALKVDSVEIAVRDTGIGIAPEFLDLIFTKFYQTGDVALHSSSKTRFKGGGPGLGLAIVRGIVEAHHGQVWADSTEFSETRLPGSTFYVLLPVSQAISAAARPAHPTAQLAART